MFELMVLFLFLMTSTFNSIKYKNVRSLNFKAVFLKMLCFQVRQFYQIRAVQPVKRQIICGSLSHSDALT